MTLSKLNIKIFADGADKTSMLEHNKDPLVKGLTTNPTLMRKNGVDDYERFAKEILEEIKEKPVSFEVFAETWEEMGRQARKIAAWQDNVFVKIPITNSQGEPSVKLVERLAQDGIQLNITAVMTEKQIEEIARILAPDQRAIISVFAGRIADTGRRPENTVKKGLALLANNRKAELLWASTREVLNIFEADTCGCHIITVPDEILKKAKSLAGKPLEELSLDTVRMFEDDARNAGFKL